MGQGAHGPQHTGELSPFLAQEADAQLLQRMGGVGPADLVTGLGLKGIQLTGEGVQVDRGAHQGSTAAGSLGVTRGGIVRLAFAQ